MSPMRQSLSLILGLILVASLVPSRTEARDEWFRGLDLEPAASRADLVMIVRVAEVSEAKMVFGGKVERAAQQFKFEPVRTLKGVFARDALLLTSEDLGVYGDERSALERGQVRLLLLGRSGIGYANQNQAGGLDQSVPPLRDENDPLRATVEVLITVSQEHDRGKKVTLLLNGLKTAKGPAAIPLLVALQRRALLAAQMPATAAAVTSHLGDPSAPVREAAARTLQLLLEADYLDRQEWREEPVAVLAADLQQKDSDLMARLAELGALGAAGEPALKNEAAVQQLKLNRPRQTFAERSVLLQIIGKNKMAGQRDALLAFVEQMPLDAPSDLQFTADRALARLDTKQALKTLVQRMKNKYALGLDVATEIALLGELRAAAAVPALLDAYKLSLNHGEKMQFAVASETLADHKLSDPRLVAPLSKLLDVRRPHLRWQAIQALRKIDTDEAAKAVHPHLREEADLFRKLQLAEFLGRHGIRDGYAFAIEHMSEPHLLEQAVAALAAMREPKAVPALRDILKTSHDTTWNTAAIRALGALGEKEFAGQFLEIVQDLKRPLALPALIALGDLGEVKALAKIKEGLASRNERIVLGSVRAAAKLIPLAMVKTDDLRDQLAGLVEDADAAQEVRVAALEALVTMKDPRLDRVLASTVRDSGLEGSGLLDRVEKLLRERKVQLA